MQEPLVDILMATYNGGRFLAAQIDSIVGQSYRNWRLTIHDDGSKDDTVPLAREYVRRFPGQVFVLEDGIMLGAAKSNFAHLMAHATAEYVMFCDQDDVWLPDKVQCSMQSLLEEEASTGKNTPLGVFTDLVVADEQLNILASSFWVYQKIKPQYLVTSMRNLAVRNCVTGCTLLMNKAALAVCLPVPSYAVMHDWWCGLKILEASGNLIPLARPTVFYRQHSGNVVGARQWGVRVVLSKIWRFRRYGGDFMANYKMSRKFVRCNIFSFFIRKIILAVR